MIKGGLGNIMKQAQEMQKKMQEAQKAVSDLRIKGEAGAGLASLEMSGDYDALKFKLSADLLKEDQEMIEDILTAVVNDAVQKVKKESKAKMAEFTGGFKLPEGFDLPGSE